MRYAMFSNESSGEMVSLVGLPCVLKEGWLIEHTAVERSSIKLEAPSLNSGRVAVGKTELQELNRSRLPPA